MRADPLKRGPLKELTSVTPESKRAVAPRAPRLDFRFAALKKECVRDFEASADKSDLCASTAALNRDRKSTRLNSSHGYISYAVFCLQNKTTHAHRAVGKELPSKVLPAGRRTRLTPLPVL